MWEQALYEYRIMRVAHYAESGLQSQLLKPCVLFLFFRDHKPTCHDA